MRVRGCVFSLPNSISSSTISNSSSHQALERLTLNPLVTIVGGINLACIAAVASLWCNWVRAPAMFRYLDHWATATRKHGSTRVVKFKTEGGEIVPPVYNDSL
ncbi:hypothetical protein TNCV_1395081 [Trichonephila clavipes]|nr:hypothetical protein TNCV_1395081 [Trichonephila clavipes]